MKRFGLDKDQEKTQAIAEDLLAVADGHVISITDVKDPVFAQKMIGDGFACIPDNGSVYSPVSGTITTVFPTKHAYGITTDQGLEVLIHIGIDTVSLKEDAFVTNLKSGDAIKAGDLIASVDLDILKKEEKDPSVIVIIPNSQDVSEVQLLKTGLQAAKTRVAQVSLNSVD